VANAELQVINALCQNKDIGTLYSTGADDMFVGYQEVWKSIKNYYNKYNSIPDIEVLQERFKIEKVNVGDETAYYLDKLREEYMSNRLETILTNAAVAQKTHGSAFILDKLNESLAKLYRLTGGAVDTNIMDFEEAERYYEEVRERTEAMGGQPGISTGLPFIDASYPSGLAPGDLVVVLGYTGRAKSLFTTLLACNAHDCGYKPMIVSLEMSDSKVRDRVYTIQGSGLFSNSELNLGQYDHKKFSTFKEKHNGNDFIVINNKSDAEITPNVVESKIDQHHPDIIIIDYAQLASDNARSEHMTTRMLNLSKEYKRLAVKKGVVIVLISSATPDGSADTSKPPRIEQVAWSKQIMYDADLGLIVHRHDDSNLVSIISGKNRNGPDFAGILEWDIDRGIIREANF